MDTYNHFLEPKDSRRGRRPANLKSNSRITHSEITRRKGRLSTKTSGAQIVGARPARGDAGTSELKATEPLGGIATPPTLPGSSSPPPIFTDDFSDCFASDPVQSWDTPSDLGGALRSHENSQTKRIRVSVFPWS
jgi:hypothetical protein